MERQTATETEAAPSPRQLERLEESFKVFTETTRELEQAYRNLTRRASRIDIELQRTNAELASKVGELERLTVNRSSILDALPNGVVVVDAAGTVGCVNPAAERILGRRAVELVGRHRDAVVGPTGDPLLVPTAVAERAKAPRETDVVCLDGSRRRISITVASLSEGGELQVLSDLTVVTRLREQVTRLDTLAALGEMAAGVAHEIRNPLNGIDGFAGLLGRVLEQRGDHSELIQYADHIRRGVSDVNSIITNLLTFASPERLTATKVSLSDVLREVTNDVARLERGRDVTVELSIPDDETAEVCGDRVKLKIIFTNLVKNALDAVGDDGRVAIAVSPRKNAEDVSVSVSDDGVGLTEEIRERLFRPFSTTKPEGTGLGLAIAHKFVSLHGGEIGFRDERPGTSFIVSLPAAGGKGRSA